MKSKTKKLTIIILSLSVAVAVLGMLLLIFACHGECGSDVHGGMWTYVCPRFYFPQVGSIVMIIVGAVGITAVSIFLGTQRLKNISKQKSVHI